MKKTVPLYKDVRLFVSVNWREYYIMDFICLNVKVEELYFREAFLYRSGHEILERKEQIQCWQLFLFKSFIKKGRKKSREVDARNPYTQKWILLNFLISTATLLDITMSDKSGKMFQDDWIFVRRKSCIVLLFIGQKS